MREFKTSLAERRRVCAYFAERYKRDPEYRLRKVNALRIRLGYAPRASVDEIAPKPGRAA